MVGERGFEPPTPWSRKRDSGVVLNVFNLLQWCFNRLIPARSPHSGVNVSPRMEVPEPGVQGILDLARLPSQSDQFTEMNSESSMIRESDHQPRSCEERFYRSGDLSADYPCPSACVKIFYNRARPIGTFSRDGRATPLHNSCAPVGETRKR